jgi:hypothetical protein
MSDELVRVLRDYQRWMKDGVDGGPSIGVEDIDGDETFGAAAARIEADARRIEELRNALERWQSYGCPDCSGDCGSANPPVACCIMRETMEALR